MSLSGSLILMIYYIINLFTHRNLSVRVRYHLLRTAALFYLVPFPVLKYLLPFPAEWETSPEMNAGFLPYRHNFVIHDQESFIADSAVWAAWIYVIAVMAITVICICQHFLKYFRGKTIVTSSFAGLESPGQMETFETIKSELRLKQKIRVGFSEFCGSPCTVGFVSPIVICPEDMKDCGRQEWDFVIRHELNHIKSRDSLVGLFSLIVMLLHCFNPLAYLLYYEISNLCEMRCDSETVKNYSPAQRKKYVEYLIDTAAKSQENPMPGAIGLIGKKLTHHMMKRRLLEMKTVKKNKRILSVLVSLAVLAAGSVSVFAYEPATEVELLSVPNPNDTYFLCENDECLKIYSEMDNTFEDKEGNVYETSPAQRALCFHKMVDTCIGDHTLHADGGCTTIYYDAQRCTKCGYVKGKEYSHETTYKKCPHDFD